ncbi:EscU/YscU/HrcU family type III secretion system export apparatus switch protein [Salmonella enterica subsp. enterica serovar Infantis]
MKKRGKKGRSPVPEELTSLLILLVGVCIIWFGGESLARQLAGMLSAGLHFDHRMVNDPNLILGQIILLIKAAMMALLPLIAGVVLVALISPVMLGGLIFSGKSLQPKFSKLNPLPGIKRMFSAQTGAELLKAVLKSTLVGCVTGFYLLVSLATNDAPDGGVADRRNGECAGSGWTLRVTGGTGRDSDGGI